MHSFTFIETNLNGADFKGADLQGSILVRAEVLGADFSEANLTGVCIEDWSVNSKTLFTNVQCDYVYRKLDEQGKPTDRFPVSRNFEPREFESLYQQVGNVVELIFQEGENWQAALFSLKKLQIEDEELGLELKGIEKRGDLWVVKVTHNEAFPRQEVELRLNSAFDEMKLQLAAKEQQINRLLGIVEDQAIALKNYSKQPLGTSNSFFIVGSTITNLSASGQIEYQEAVSQVRNVVANNSNLTEANHLAQSLLTQLQNQNIAPTPLQQAELIEQLILLEAQKDAFFKQIFVQQGQQFAAAMPDSAITTAIRNAIAQLTPR
ncbi:MAG: pentapeptide repeat-containing protein [Desertifilum sp.]|nr:pentapeptide repeat-containing protein [Desertifilum sp.]